MPARIHVNVQLVVLVPPLPVSACGPRHPSDSTGTASASAIHNDCVPRAAQHLANSATPRRMKHDRCPDA
eukprot:14941153-Heterocapsa_arctica.AAC.1